VRGLALIACAVALLAAARPAKAGSYPARVPTWWHAYNRPAWFAQAWCLHDGWLHSTRPPFGRVSPTSHRGEGGWPSATGNGYEGGLQFRLDTWLSVNGPVAHDGHWASVASPREQLYRAWLVWKRDGGSFREWGTARGCGLR
jgi:hypothetical protein